MLEIASYIKEKYPHIPIILFPKGVSNNLEEIRDLDGKFDVFGIDWSTPMQRAKEILSPKYTLQGNVEPSRIYSKEALEKCVRAVADRMKDLPHIFNLGHGIIPNAPIENVKYFVDIIREVTSQEN